MLRKTGYFCIEHITHDRPMPSLPTIAHSCNHSLSYYGKCFASAARRGFHLLFHPRPCSSAPPYVVHTYYMSYGCIPKSSLLYKAIQPTSARGSRTNKDNTNSSGDVQSTMQAKVSSASPSPTETAVFPSASFSANSVSSWGITGSVFRGTTVKDLEEALASHAKEWRSIHPQHQPLGNSGNGGVLSLAPEPVVLVLVHLKGWKHVGAPLQPSSSDSTRGWSSSAVEMPTKPVRESSHTSIASAVRAAMTRRPVPFPWKALHHDDKLEPETVSIDVPLSAESGSSSDSAASSSSSRFTDPRETPVVWRVDASTCPEITALFDIRYLPTWLCFRNTRLMGRVEGGEESQLLKLVFPPEAGKKKENDASSIFEV